MLLAGRSFCLELKVDNTRIFGKNWLAHFSIDSAWTDASVQSVKSCFEKPHDPKLKLHFLVRSYFLISYWRSISPKGILYIYNFNFMPVGFVE